MADKCIIATTEDGETVVRNLEKCDSRVSPGRMREMYAYCLLHGKKPTHIVEAGIETTYYAIRRNEAGIVESGHRDVVPIKLVVGDEDELSQSTKATP
jgi:hypothetical protein